MRLCASLLVCASCCKLDRTRFQDRLSTLETDVCLDIRARFVLWAEFYAKHCPDHDDLVEPHCTSAAVADVSISQSALYLWSCLASPDFALCKRTTQADVQLVHDLSSFARHVGRRSLEDDLHMMFVRSGGMFSRFTGVTPMPLLSDAREGVTCRGVIERANALCLEQGFVVKSGSMCHLTP
eukprot:TRINITY_DN13098_c0_g1_i1.p2 TRINITY_DN13098_c0_g1~~TRINITY_DN13098_c0_g1_i1.p2  ORF type:complete len:182 (-),score=10.87 TRINITY_DN13098_c0_g1_i1:463-1008(-)